MSSQSTSKKPQMRGTGRPRLTRGVRARIVQIRASDREHPPSIDAILDRLQKEGIDPLPARGSVHNVIREWEKQPEEVRRREFPFEWHRLEDARIPWEASSWILCCQEARLAGQLDAVALDRREKERIAVELGINPASIVWHVVGAVFTNRLATWYWRIHWAAPDLGPKDVQPLALLCAAQERMKDIVGTPMDITMLEEWLILRPDKERRSNGFAGAWRRYWDAVDLGLVKHPIPKTPEEAVEYVTTMLRHQIDLNIFRRPGAEYFYTGPHPVMLWEVLNGVSLPTQTTTERGGSDEPKKEEHNERRSSGPEQEQARETGLQAQLGRRPRAATRGGR